MNARVNDVDLKGRSRLGLRYDFKKALQDRGIDVREAKERTRDTNTKRLSEAISEDLGSIFGQKWLCYYEEMCF